MRTIEFRGLRVDGMGWAYGFIGRVQNDDSTYDYLISEDTTRHQRNVRRCVFMVHPESVGQFTGLYDKNGVKVFEGDTVVTDCVLVFGEPVDGFAGVVKYLECCFYIDSGTDALKVWSDAYQVEVTGNIHEPATVRE